MRLVMKGSPVRVRASALKLWAEMRAMEAYERYRSGRMKNGRRFSRPPNPYVPPEIPQGKVNLTDPDSRIINDTRSRGFLQGYNAQAVTKENQIVIAAEVMTAAADFGHLEPMLTAAERELDAAGITDAPDVALGDAGYWHHEQIERLTSRGVQVLIPSRRQTPRGRPARLAGRPLE